MKKKRSTKSYLSFFDISIVVVCTIGIIVSLGLFIKDMNVSLVSQDQEPIGVVYFKKNTAQRRLINRNLWERVKTSTPIYDGDRIRTGDFSEACLVLSDGTEIELYENTLVQIFGKGDRSLNFENGSISIVSGSNDTSSGTITVKTIDKVISIGENTSTLISSVVSAADKSVTETVMAVSSGEIQVKPLVEKKAGNNTAPYEIVSAGSVATYESKIAEPELTEKTEPVKKSEPAKEKGELKVIMPVQSYTASQNKDEIKFVPFFWTEEKDVRIEFSNTQDFNSIIDTEYLSSETHKGSVSLDFTKNGDVVYWRLLPAKEKSDSGKIYPTGKIIVRSDESKQQEIKEAVSSVFGNDAATQIAVQVEEKEKVVTKNEAVAMTDIKPATTSVKNKTETPVLEKQPITTIENYLKTKAEAQKQEEAKKKEETKAEITVETEKAPSEEKTAEVKDGTGEKIETAPAKEETAKPVEKKTVKPRLPVLRKPKKPAVTKNEPEVKNDEPSKLEPEKETEKSENLTETKEIIPETSETEIKTEINTETKTEEKTEEETPLPAVEPEPVIPAIVDLTPELMTPVSGKKFTEEDFSNMDDPFIEFKWEEMEGAQAYKFILKNEAGSVIWTTTVRTNKYILMDRIDLISEDGIYSWEITGITKVEEEVYTSKTASRTFRIEIEEPEAVSDISGNNFIKED